MGYSILILMLLIHFSQARVIFKFENKTNTANTFADCLISSKISFNSIILMSDEVKNAVLTINMIKYFQIPITLANIGTDVPDDAIYLVLSMDKNYYYALLNNKAKGSRSKIFILWDHDNVSNDIMNGIFSVAWDHTFYNIYILTVHFNSHINIYSYFPFGPNHCHETGLPVHLDIWKVYSRSLTTQKFNFSSSYRRLNLVRDFFGCPLKCIARNRPPEFIAILGQNKSVQLEGSGGRIFKTIMKKFNFTVSITLAEEELNIFKRDKNGFVISQITPLMIAEALMTKNYDFAFGVFSYLTFFSSDMQFSFYYLNENFAFHVPCGMKEVDLFWKNYYMEFTTFNWIAISFLLIWFSFSLKIISKLLPEENAEFLSFWGNMYKLIAIHLESIVLLKTSTHTMRFLLTVLMFYCTVLLVAYKASLKSFLMAPNEVNSIQTWEELAESNLAVTGTLNTNKVLTRISRDNPVLRKITTKLKTKLAGNFSEILEGVTVRQDTAYFGPESMIAYYNSKRNEENGTSKQNVCQVNGIVAVSPAAPFLMLKGSSLLEMVNQITLDLVHTGHMNMFTTFSAVKTSPAHGLKKNQVKYSIEHLKGAFLLWLFGIILAFFVLIVEVSYNKFSPCTKVPNYKRQISIKNVCIP